MASVEVFDPAMCCSTGVCGPTVAPRQEPEKFIACAPVHEAVNTQGEEALPALLVDGLLRSTGRYPGRAELAGWVGITLSQPVPVAAGIRELPQAGSCCGGTGCC